MKYARNIRQIIALHRLRCCSRLVHAPPGFKFLSDGIVFRARYFFVEIESASVDYLRDQDKIKNKIPVVSVSDRGKRIANYSTCSHIYTVDYEIKGDRGKMLGKTIEVGNVP